MASASEIDHVTQRLLTQQEAADFLQVCVKSIYNLRTTGKLKAVVWGKGNRQTVRIWLSELVRFAKEATEGETKEAR